MNGKLTVFERRIEMLFMLNSRRKMTVVEFASEFSVSEDTISRDIVFLSRYAPIYTKSGIGGGVFILDGYNGIPKYLSNEEKSLLERLAIASDDKDKKIIGRIIYKFSMPK